MNIYVIWRLSGHGLGAPPPTQAHLWARKVTAEFNAQRYKKMLGLVFPIACFFLTSGLARGTPQASAHIRGLSRPRQLWPSHSLSCCSLQSTLMNLILSIYIGLLAQSTHNPLLGTRVLEHETTDPSYPTGTVRDA